MTKVDSNWSDILSKVGYPATVLVLDFETYYDKDYSLKNLSTVEYVKDKRFEITGLGAGDPSQQTDRIEFFSPDKIKQFLAGVPFNEITIVGQYLFFDCLILREHFGITPRFTIDIRDLAKFFDARDKHDLATMAKRFDASKQKGDVQLFKGLHWGDMNLVGQKALEEYCKGDVEIESYLFQKLIQLLSNPDKELRLATHCLHAFLEPNVEIDFILGEQLKVKMKEEMMQLVWETGAGQKEISGNTSFLNLLRKELPDDKSIPMKVGKKGYIPALARDDEGMTYLLNHKNPKVRTLAAARLAVKSWPLHIARVDNLMAQARARDGKIGAPISYYAAHTGRWGGTEGINLQNLGGRGRGKPIHPLISQVRGMLKAPQDCIFGIGDFAQIEARILAWLAGQDDLVKGFTNGKDIYSEFATELFKTPVRKTVESDPKPIAKMLTIRRGFGKDTILGCGYGMGTSLFFERCRTNPDLRPLFDNGEYNYQFIERLIKTYRTKYAKIPEFWRNVEKSWRFVTKYPHELVTDKKLWPLEFYHQDKATFILLPSGRYLRYPYASVSSDGQCKYRWSSNLWGGFLVENIVQAVARDILAEAILRLLDAGYKVLFTSHDEVICLLKDKSELKQMLDIMCVVPMWATGLPINVEGCVTERYKK